MKKSIFQILLLGLFCARAVSAADLNIEITQGIDNPIPIAIVPFTWEGANALGEDVAEIVSADLQQVGEFRALGRANMLSMPDEAAEVYFRDWRILAQDYLLIGKINHGEMKEGKWKEGLPEQCLTRGILLLIPNMSRWGPRIIILSNRIGFMPVQHLRHACLNSLRLVSENA